MMKYSFGFSLAEALISLLIVCILTIASIPVITKKHRSLVDRPHGSYACYWKDNALVAKYEENNQVKDGKVVFDKNENRYGCEFEPPKGARNFMFTIIGGGGGGAGSALGSNIKKYEKYTYLPSEAGIYEFLIVGAGGDGGKIRYEGEEQYSPQLRAMTGMAADFIYVPPTFIPKTTFYISPATKVSLGSSINFGSTIDHIGEKYNTFAEGGTGDKSLTYRFVNYSNKIVNSLDLYYFHDNTDALLICTKDPGVYELLDSKTIYEYKKAQTSSACPLSVVRMDDNSHTNGSSFSKIKNAVIYDMSKKLNGSIMSVYHQNDKKYNNIEELSNYSEKFGVEFNKKVKGSNHAYFKTASGHRDFEREANACSGADWTSKGYCVDYENNYGAGGGGQGVYGNAMYSERVPGKQGVIFIKQLKIYAGLGGNAGNMSQTTYQILNDKIVMFPGKGGKGGLYSSNIVKTGSGYTGNEKTAGKSGEASYIKNSSQVLGGSGASMIYPDKESSYSPLVDDEQSIPIGGNGKLAVPPKDGLVGGLGGFNGKNNSFDGQTQNVFKNNAILGNVSKITGAGSGGGGGAVFVSNNDDYTINQGVGGDGASGLVFVQW